MRRTPGMTLTAVCAAGVLAIGALSACAEPGTVGGPPAKPPPGEATPTGVPTTEVPEVGGLSLRAAQARLAEAKLAAVVRYVAEGPAGAVVYSEPRPGARAAAGDTVVLVVAGKPATIAGFDGRPGAQALATLAKERPDVFVGAGYAGGDPALPFVVAVNPGVEVHLWQARIAAAAGDERFEVKQCAHALADLRRVQTEVTGSDLLRSGPPFGVALEPARCAVVVSGGFGADLRRQIAQKWGSAVAVTVA